MFKLSWGQVTVLVIASVPMAAVGIAGAVATFVNMDNVLHRTASALGLVAAGEGATLICALVALAVTLMGQHTPPVVRLGMWIIPLIASGVGVALAPTFVERVTMAVTPLAMTAAGEGVAFVARRVVAYRTDVDIEQQRRSGLLLWHANRAANGRGLGKKISEAAVWRLTKQFAATDGQLSVQLGHIQRGRISEGADRNLAAVLSGGRNVPQAPALPPVEDVPALPARNPGEALSEAPVPFLPVSEWAEQVEHGDGCPIDGGHEAADCYFPQVEQSEGLPDWMTEALAVEEARVEAATTVRLLTNDDVAVQLNVKPGTVRSWVHRGRLRVHDRDAQGRALFHPDDVDQMPPRT